MTLPKGYKLCYAVAPELAEKSIIAVNAPGNITSGEVTVRLVNAGREIVDVKDGDPVLTCWIEEDILMAWEEK